MPHYHSRFSKPPLYLVADRDFVEGESIDHYSPGCFSSTLYNDMASQSLKRLAQLYPEFVFGWVKKEEKGHDYSVSSYGGGYVWADWRTA